LGDVLGALTCYQRALSIDPLDVNVNLSLAFACLQVGRFEQGWNAYEWRWKDQHLSSPILQTQKPMLAKQQRTKRLLIWPEQGVGTEVMFSRFFHRLHELAYEVIIKMDPRLIDLMQRSFTQLSFQPNDVHIDDSQFDHHLPLASLAQHWIQSMADLRILSPRALSVDSIKKKHLLQKHPRQRPIWVGINWRSRSKTTGHDRSFDLMEVLSQLKRSDVTFVNLQYGSIKEELQTLEHTDIDFLDVPDVDKTQDLDGLAALCACCDVVISADNSTAHLCGAMGVPTWMGLPMNADWRWFKDMAHTPWYPNMRLFRQTRLGSWREVFLSMKEALDQAIERHHFNA
jgi:hypothetical protein